MNPVESAFLWKAYASVGDGIAIRTTISNLKASLKDTIVPIYIGPVEYIDFETEVIREGNLLNPIFKKRLSFKPEQELRCVTVSDGPFRSIESGPDAGQFDLTGFPGGIEVPVDMPKLVQEVRVAPSAPEWFERVVVNSCVAFDLQVSVGQSTVSGKAIF